MLDKTTHFFPDAMVVFVKGFQRKPRLDDTIVASNVGEVKEISQVSVTLTVKNNPGTFNLTLVNTDNKFIARDDPNAEIAALFKMSSRKITSATKTITQRAWHQVDEKHPEGISTNVRNQTGVDDAGNFFEFPTYADWLNFQSGVLEDIVTGERYPISYRRSNNGRVVERWTFTSYGDHIIVVKDGDMAAESAFQAAVNGSTQSYNTFDSKSLKSFVLWKFTNQQLFEIGKDPIEQGYGLSTFKAGRCKIAPMDRVVIFMAQRFDDSGTVNQGSGRTKLQRVFTGVVNTVQQGFSDNQETVSVSGEDITKYMRLSVIAVNPGLLLDPLTAVDQSSEDAITVWGDIFKGLSPPEIIRLLTIGGAYTQAGEFRAPITGVTQYRTAKVGTAVDRVYNVDTGKFEERTPPKGRKDGSRIVEFGDMLGILFQDPSVHIINPYYKNIGGFRPYELALSRSWSFYQADFKTRRDIAYNVAEETNFVFYADRNGEIWFHPPRFSNLHILGAPNPYVYIIDSESIISYGLIEDDANVFSSVYVTTTPPFGMDEMIELGKYAKSFRDDGIMLKYGQRIFTYFNPLINVTAGTTDTTDSKSLMLNAKSMLQRLLASKSQGQITLTCRAELSPGYPVYVPARNMIYYVETVEHNVSFGGRATTTIHLSYGHKPWEYLPEVLAFSANDEVYMTDAYQLVTMTDIKTPEQTAAENVTGVQKSSQQAQKTPKTVQLNYTPANPTVIKDAGLGRK